MNVLEFDELSGDAEDARAAAVRKYLTNNGWRYTSQHPGSYWMWSITTFDRHRNAQLEVAREGSPITYVVDETVAIRIQRHWELEAQNFNAHDPECPIFDTFDWEDCNCIVHDIIAGTRDEDGVPIETEDDLAVLDGDGDTPCSP